MGASTRSQDPHIFALPRPDSTSREKQNPYTTDYLPKPRDVASPYGISRVYEWGLPDGPKVLFVHGLLRPAPMLGKVAEALARRGHRVMLLDLWGRGYSDAPSDLPHDFRLYLTQIFLALASSDIPWTGNDSGGFAVIGYSLGGGIAVEFARFFPQLVSSLILMAPGGLLHALPWYYRLLAGPASWILPLNIKKWMIKRFWNGPPEYIKDEQRSLMNGLVPPYEVLDARQLVEDGTEDEAYLDFQGAVDWDIDNHPGFVHSVTSALRYGPILDRNSSWRQVGSYLDGNPETGNISGLPNRLWRSQVLLLLGDGDAVVPTAETLKEALIAFGKDNVKVETFPGGHLFPIVCPWRVADAIVEFWSQRQRPT